MTHVPQPTWTVVACRFHGAVVHRLVAGAVDCLRKKGVSEGSVRIARVAGAFELPLAALVLAEASPAPIGIVALGCVIRGETPHFHYVCSGVTRGLMDVALRTRVPVGFGLLTCDSMEQALSRAGGDRGDKGWEAAEAAWDLAKLIGR